MLIKRGPAEERADISLYFLLLCVQALIHLQECKNVERQQRKKYTVVLIF